MVLATADIIIHPARHWISLFKPDHLRAGEDER